mgnify:CR=1 FL=1
MKKQPLFLCILGACALLSMSGYSQKAQDSKTLEERVQQLEAQLEAMQSTMDGMAASSAAEASALDAINAYLQQQAKAAQSMASVLDEAEKLGFVPGINFPSREALLKGWRAQINVQQKGVPGKTKAKPETGDTRFRKWDK